MAPRSIWNGTISLRHDRVPIKVHSATESKTVRFKQVHEPDGARIEHKRVAPRRRGGALRRHRQGLRGLRGRVRRAREGGVDAAAGERSRLHRHRGVRRRRPRSTRSSSTAPTTWARATPATPTGCCTTRSSAPAAPGSARLVFHNREYLVAIRPLDGVLALHTMRFADELVDADELDIPPPRASRPSARSRWPGSSSTRCTSRLRPRDAHDSYRDHVLDADQEGARARRRAQAGRAASEAPTTCWPRSRRA